MKTKTINMTRNLIIAGISDPRFKKGGKLLENCLPNSEFHLVKNLSQYKKIISGQRDGNYNLYLVAHGSENGSLKLEKPIEASKFANPIVKYKAPRTIMVFSCGATADRGSAHAMYKYFERESEDGNFPSGVIPPVVGIGSPGGGLDAVSRDSGLDDKEELPMGSVLAFLSSYLNSTGDELLTEFFSRVKIPLVRNKSEISLGEPRIFGDLGDELNVESVFGKPTNYKKADEIHMMNRIMFSG